MLVVVLVLVLRVVSSRRSLETTRRRRWRRRWEGHLAVSVDRLTATNSLHKQLETRDAAEILNATFKTEKAPELMVSSIDS